MLIDVRRNDKTCQRCEHKNETQIQMVRGVYPIEGYAEVCCTCLSNIFESITNIERPGFKENRKYEKNNHLE